MSGGSVKPIRLRGAADVGVTVAPALVVLCVISTWLAAGLPGFGPPFLYAVLVASMVRIAVGFQGERLVPPRMVIVLSSVLGIAGVILIFGQSQVGQGASVVGLLCVISAFQSLLLLGSFDGSRAYVLILLSSVQTVGTAFLRKDLEALVLVVAYAGALVWALLQYERRHALTRPPPRTQTIRRVRQVRSRPLPWRVSLRTITALICVGFPLAFALLFVIPPSPDPRDAYDFEAEARSDEGAHPFDGGEGIGVPQGAEWRVGPSQESSHVPRGNPSAIKQSHIVFCEVRERGVAGPPRDVFLRDNAQDVYSANGDWRASKSLLEAGARMLHRDENGWIRIPGPTPLSGAERHYRIRLHRNAYNRWFLQPHALRARLLRGGRAISAAIDYSGNDTLMLKFMRRPAAGFEKGDVIEQVCIRQRRSREGVRNDRFLRGRRSDAGVSPLPTYLELPDSTRRAVTPVARGLVGGVTDPWDRAVIIERALKDPPYEYTMANVAFRGPDDMADFFDGNGRGACGRFASAMVTLLRSLGHPARYVRGFWGGEPIGNATVFRYSHYHAWCELYLDDVGWVALNPTPPDRQAADRQVGEHAEDVANEEDPTRTTKPPSTELLEFDRETYDDLWAGIGQFFQDTIGKAARWAFGPESGFAGLWTMLLALGILVFRGRRRALRLRAAGPGGTLPKGPYGRTLLMLARKGIRRPGHQTPRELWQHVAGRFPDAASPLQTLTEAFERERYGGPGGRERATLESGARAKAALRALEAALTPKRG